MYIICFEILTCTIWQPTDYNIIVFVLFAHESRVKKGIHIRVINIFNFSFNNNYCNTRQSSIKVMREKEIDRQLKRGLLAS